MALRPGNPRRAACGTPIPGPGTTIPGPGRIGKRGISRFPIPAESEIGDSLPVFRPNRAWYPRFPDLRSGNGRFHVPHDSRCRPSRESGIPSPFPGQIGNRGNGNYGFPGLMALQGQPQAEESPGPGQVLKGTEGRVPVSSCGVFPFESSSSPHRSAGVPGVILAPLCQRHRTCNRRLVRTRPCATNGNRFSSLQFLLLALHLDLVGETVLRLSRGHRPLQPL